jgi:hypothetical protein
MSAFKRKPREKTYGKFIGDDGSLVYRFGQEDFWYDGPVSEFRFLNKEVKRLHIVKSKLHKELETAVLPDDLSGFNSLPDRIENCDRLINRHQKRLLELHNGALQNKEWHLGLVF